MPYALCNGRNFARTALAELLHCARPSDVPYVVRRDPLERSLRELHDILEELKMKALRFISPEKRIDTTSAGG